MSYFNKILIANRGEIARRIIRTCRKLEIKTVTVYSDADISAPFVGEADEAYHIGSSQAKDSYLNIKKIIEIAKLANVEAIHPGYGFLSENPLFAKECEEAGITFIGPNSRIIDLMGSKVKARHTMAAAGVPVVPGWDTKIESLNDAVLIANKISYPLMLKASAGGGGIGMEIIHHETQLRKEFSIVKNNAAISFGDDTIFFEKYIENARHIEVQILADNYGQVVHLFDRECSIQRRNQKIVEESPSPAITKELREVICNVAVEGCKNIGYTNAGTMEFLLDVDTGEYYFLEMNTRLQVEHPVTEEVTGIDLVEMQIKVAANEHLKLTQDSIKQQGYAIEMRLYAEDPIKFIPSPGVINKLELPKKNVRFDFRVKEGCVVTPFYDPLIGKIIVHGENRKEALAVLEDTLNSMKIEGINTNLELLKAIARDSEFIKGNYTTHYIEQRQLMGMI